MASDGVHLKTLVDKFERLYIDERSVDSPLVKRLLPLFPADKVEWVNKEPLSESRGELSASEFDRSKRRLFLTPFAGKFFKRCPGAKPGLLCCNYFVLNWGQQCDMNCSYCYLQSFINRPMMTLYTNIEDACDDLRSMHAAVGEQKVRVGTGETVDSLSLDPLTGFASELITLFRDFPKWTVEFKTKSAFVDQFLDVPHAGNAIVSWSLNPAAVVAKEEHGTASLADRLAAAERCRSKGFPLGFHIDPIIWHPEWKKNYDTLVDELCTRFSPADVSFLSLGALRFQPEQRHLMRERFGMSSWVMQSEMHPSRDGKLRYASDLRKQMFDHILNRFKERDPAWRIFLCMETPETWAATPHKDEAMDDLFDPRVVQKVKRAEN